jgi:hypothetical protein
VAFGTPVAHIIAASDPEISRSFRDRLLRFTNFLWVLYAIFMAPALASICNQRRNINMKYITENSLNAYENHVEQTSNNEKRESRLLSGGLISLISGALAPVLGSLLTAMSWFIGNQKIGHSLDRLGSIFLISTFPLLSIAAFCLDSYEKRSKRTVSISGSSLLDPCQPASTGLIALRQRLRSDVEYRVNSRDF